VEVSGDLPVLAAGQLPPTEDRTALTPGMLIFDMMGAMNNLQLTTTLVVETDACTLFMFDTEGIMQLIDTAPLLLLGLLKSIIIPPVILG